MYEPNRVINDMLQTEKNLQYGNEVWLSFTLKATQTEMWYLVLAVQIMNNTWQYMLRNAMVVRAFYAAKMCMNNSIICCNYG